MSTSAETAEPVDLMPGKSALKKAREPKPKSVLPRPKSLAMQPLPFFKWLGKFTDEQKGRATLSVYRDWPVIDKKLTDPNCKRPRLIAWFGDGNPMPIEDPNEWADFFLKNPEWGGSGEYKCICNEVGLHGAIALTHFKFKDAEYPPVVDPAIVIQGHPENKGYLDGLRARGIPIPGESTNEEKDMNVAAQLVDTVTKTNERLMDRIEELQEDQTEETPIEESVTQAAVKAGFELMSEATKNAMGVVTDQNKKLAATQAPDTLELLKNAKELFTPAVASGDGNMKIFEMFMQTQRESLSTVQTMHKDTLEFMQKMEEKREAQATTPQQNGNATGLSSTLQAVREFKEIADLFGFKAGRREIEAPPVSEPVKPWYQSYLENPIMLFTGLALLQGTVGAIFNRGGGPQKSVADTIREAQEAGKSMLQSVTQPPAQPSPQDQQARAQAQAQEFLKFIEQTFLAHFYDSEKAGYSGFTFAAELRAIRQDQNTGQIAWVPGGPETNEGISMYRNIKNGGVEQFDKLIQSYPPIWQMVQGMRPKYNQFLQELFNFEEESARQAPQSQPAGVN